MGGWEGRAARRVTLVGWVGWVGGREAHLARVVRAGRGILRDVKAQQQPVLRLKLRQVLGRDHAGLATRLKASKRAGAGVVRQGGRAGGVVW